MRRKVLSSIGRINAEIEKRVRQLHNIGQKFALLGPEVMLGIEELDLDKVLVAINKEEFKLERRRLREFVAATDSNNKIDLNKSGSLGLFKFIIESKLSLTL